MVKRDFLQDFSFRRKIRVITRFNEAIAFHERVETVNECSDV